jgi:hypothetical protein
MKVQMDTTREGIENVSQNSFIRVISEDISPSCAIVGPGVFVQGTEGEFAEVTVSYIHEDHYPDYRF